MLFLIYDPSYLRTKEDLDILVQAFYETWQAIKQALDSGKQSDDF